MAYTTENKVRGVMGVTDSELSDAELETPIAEAASLVDYRLGDYITETDVLTLIETRVAAHFALSHLTNASKGKQIESIKQSSATVKYVAPDGKNSTHWDIAVSLDYTGRLNRNIKQAKVYE